MHKTSSAAPSTPSGRDLLAQVRGNFIARHTTLTQWARANGTDVSAVRQALFGTWAGPKGRAMRARVLKAAGVQEAA